MADSLSLHFMIVRFTLHNIMITCTLGTGAFCDILVIYIVHVFAIYRIFAHEFLLHFVPLLYVHEINVPNDLRYKHSIWVDLIVYTLYCV